MTTDQLDRALRAADPTRADDTVPAVETTVRAARCRADAPPTAVRPRRRRTWVATGAAAAVAAVLAVGIPLLDSRSTPTAQATIRLAPFAGLMTPYVLSTTPAGLEPVQFYGQQATTSASYVPAVPGEDGVVVTHSLAAPTPRTDGIANAAASRQEADATWVSVTGYGRFAVDATVTALLGTAIAAPETSPLRVALAPSGWALAAFKDLQPGEGVVTLSPSGGIDDPVSLTVIRYRSTAADFPAGYQDQGPTSALTSLARPGILMRGAENWTLQLRLPDGGSLVLLLPIRMDRDQVQRFADGVTVPG